MKAQGFRTAFIRARELLPHALRNIISHPMDFLSYERKTGFLAAKSALRYLAEEGPIILDNAPALRLLRAWRNP